MSAAAICGGRVRFTCACKILAPRWSVLNARWRSILPGPADLLFEVAQLHERMGNHEAALELVQQAQDDRPESLPVHLLQADLLTRLNRPQAALAVLERALRVAQSVQAPDGEL